VEEVAHELGMRCILGREVEKHSTSEVTVMCKYRWLRENWVVMADDGGSEDMAGCERHCTHTIIAFNG
jgi:hypothetical protein